MVRDGPQILASALRRFLASEAAGGLALIASAALALGIANSPLSAPYRAVLAIRTGGVSLLDWINNGLMALFFLVVGLEIKREVLHGQLRTWSARALPGCGALGGMIVPAAIYAAVNAGHSSIRGWAIPAATDIAFALGVIALLGRAVPVSLKLFLTALAVLDDLGAVLIIALAYTHDLSLPMLGLAGVTFAILVVLNRAGMRSLPPFLACGALLWVFIFRSGVHATLAGVLLAMTIPAHRTGERGQDRHTALHRLERRLGPWVAFLILPLFGFANAGVHLAQTGWSAAAAPITLGVALGLALGKQTGVMSGVWLACTFNIARRPAGATWMQVYGIALLCGVGFTMSLFIGLLAFAGLPGAQDDAKIGVLVGSLLSAGAGALILLIAPKAGRPGTPPAGEVTDR